MQKFFNTVSKTIPVRVTGSGTALLGKLEPTTAMEKKKRNKAEKVQEQLCCAMQHKGPRGGACGFKQDQKQELHKKGSTDKQCT